MAEGDDKVFGGFTDQPRKRVGKCRWTVEIEVADCWVEDGFEATAERVHEMICTYIGYCHHHEIKVKLVSSPDRDVVRELQGYPPAAKET